MKYLQLPSRFLLVFACVLSVLPQLTAAQSVVQPHDLRCEYLTDPLGIDVRVPRLSWKQADPTHVRGQKQTAYHVLVSSSKELLAQDSGDLWDSGKIISSQSALVTYGGSNLVSNQDCYWKVRQYDKDGSATGWSVPARFSMGLLEASDWKRPWFHHPDAPAEKHIWFRKNVRLDENPGSAFLHVASLGYHELYVNGVRVDSSAFGPALTRLDKRVLYITYDLRSLLKLGDNTIALWQGPGWARYSFFNTRPSLRVQLDAKSSSGQALNLFSNDPWRCQTSSSENVGPTQFEDNGGEKIDARNHVTGWNAVGFNDSAWRTAVDANIQVALSAHMLEPARIIETIPAKSVTVNAGIYKANMGKNFTGLLSIKLRGLSAGDQVTIQIADDGGTLQDNGQKCFFISKGDSEELFQNRFNYTAGRYITITGAKSPVLVTDVGASALSTDVKRTGMFSSSSTIFNRIYEMDLWTWRANLVEGFTMDCPHRERLGYGEISFSCPWGIAYPNYETGALFTKNVRDWSDVQEASGWIHPVAPQINNFSYGGPMWSSAGLTMAWHFYQNYGDKRILSLTYPSSKRWLEFLNTKLSNGLLTNYTGSSGKFLGDWGAPGRTEWGNSPEAMYFNNCVYAMNLINFIDMARILGESGDVTLYSQRLATLKDKIHATYFNATKNCYSNGTQVQYAFALLTGIPPENLRPAIIASFQKELKDKGYLDMGSSGLPVLFKYLIEEAANSDALFAHLSKTNEPSYGYFLARDATTWPEFWNVNVQSQIHTCYTGVSSWFTKGLGGIRPDPASPGFQSFLIKPVVGGDLTFAEFSSESPYGLVRNRWERNGDTLRMFVKIPPNSQATIYVPTSDPTSLTEGGMPIAQAPGVSQILSGTGQVEMKVAAGQYEFSSNLINPNTYTRFNFEQKKDVALNTQIESNVFTILGLGATQAAVSIVGGDYAVSTDNGITYGAWKTTAGLVSENQKIKVRVKSANAYLTQVAATLRIAGLDKPFSVTTIMRPPSGPRLSDLTRALDFGVESHPNDDNNVRKGEINVGSIRNGNWIAFQNCDFGIGVTSFLVNAGSGSAGGKVEVRLDSPTGSLIGSVDIPNTGGWGVIAPFSTNILTPATGKHDLYLVFVGGSGFLLDIQSFRFELRTVGNLISALDFSVESHPTDANNVRKSGLNVGYIKNGNWIAFNGCDFGFGVSSLVVNAGSGSAGGKIEFRVDSPSGPLIGSVDVPNTGGWGVIAPFTTNTLAPTSGIQDLFLVFQGSSSGYLIDIQSFKFELLDPPPQESYDAWKVRLGITGIDDNGPVPHRIAYAMGLTPVSGEFTLPEPSIKNLNGTGFFAVPFSKSKKAVNVVLNPQCSDDMVKWENLPATYVINEGDEGELSNYKVMLPLDGSSFKFIRFSAN